MELLPKWTMTKSVPAFEDHESATCMEQTYKLYQTMQNLIKEYNDFVDETNAKLVEFAKTYEGDIEVFTTSLRQEFQDFIDITDLKLQDLERQISEGGSGTSPAKSFEYIIWDKNQTEMQLTSNSLITIPYLDPGEDLSYTLDVNGYKVIFITQANRETNVNIHFIDSTINEEDFYTEDGTMNGLVYDHPNIERMGALNGYCTNSLDIIFSDQFQDMPPYLMIEHDKNDVWTISKVLYGEN